MSDTEETSAVKEKVFSVREFFEDVPPGKQVGATGLVLKTNDWGGGYLALPDLNLYCMNDACGGYRWFKCHESYHLSEKSANDHFITYLCKNCGQTEKCYAVRIQLEKGKKTGKAFKFGEIPSFGPPTPPKVVSILGAEREYYFKGRRSENQGLGIAAFAYYRRVVENQKDKIFDEMIKTVQKVDPTNAVLIEELQSAKKETQFTKAVDTIKHGIPQTLLIDGHNPLTLLHSALSEGMHAKTDEECLGIATSIRVILTDLVERMASAVKDTVELKSAISKILQYKNPPPGAATSRAVQDH